MAMDHAIANARFEMRLKALEEEQVDRKALVKQLKMALLAAIIGAVFTAQTVIEMVRGALRGIGK